MTNNNKIKEPLIRVVRRDDVTKLAAFFIKFFAIILSCIICLAAIYVLTGSTPDKVAQAMGSEIFGFGTRQMNNIMKA